MEDETLPGNVRLNDGLGPNLENEMNMIATGTRVITPLGPGLAVGQESFYGGKLVRHLVRLDDPSRWAFGDKTDVAAFFGRELQTETCVRVLADGEPCGLVAPCPDCGRACHDVGIGGLGSAIRHCTTTKP